MMPCTTAGATAGNRCQCSTQHSWLVQPRTSSATCINTLTRTSSATIITAIGPSRLHTRALSYRLSTESDLHTRVYGQRYIAGTLASVDLLARRR
eukprot:scaffold137512_cov19-Prasinocladus_malaysianus.AAC.1